MLWLKGWVSWEVPKYGTHCIPSEEGGNAVVVSARACVSTLNKLISFVSASQRTMEQMSVTALHGEPEVAGAVAVAVKYCVFSGKFMNMAHAAFLWGKRACGYDKRKSKYVSSEVCHLSGRLCELG